MRTLSHRGLILAGVAAMALAYGVTRLLLRSAPEGGSPGPLGIGAQGGAPSENTAGPAVSGRRRQVGVAASVRFESVSDEPPIDLGEMLDADGGDSEELYASERDPVSIGPELEADEPLPYEPGSLYTPPRNLGEPLDAAGLGVLRVVGEEPVNVGPDLDADDPQGSDFYYPVPRTLEIGEIMEAGAPRAR